jgi:hypothetical protein
VQAPEEKRGKTRVVNVRLFNERFLVQSLAIWVRGIRSERAHMQDEPAPRPPEPIELRETSIVVSAMCHKRPALACLRLLNLPTNKPAVSRTKRGFFTLKYLARLLKRFLWACVATLVYAANSYTKLDCRPVGPNNPDWKVFHNNRIAAICFTTLSLQFEATGGLLGKAARFSLLYSLQEPLFLFLACFVVYFFLFCFIFFAARAPDFLTRIRD